MKARIRYLKKKILYMVLFPMRVLPIRKNRIILHNDLGLKYSDNPKAVAEYILANYPGQFDVVYPVNDCSKYQWLEERGIRTVPKKSISYFYYVMTAKVFLTNSGGYSYLPLRKSQYVINTWHGGGAYKKCGIYMYEDTPTFRNDLKMAAQKTNVMLSTCARFTDAMTDSLLIPRSAFWNIGMPRTDGIMAPDENKRREVRSQIGIKENERLVLFAPTYRKIEDNYFNDSVAIDYGIDSKRVCKALEKRFGGVWRFAFRLHPLVVNRDKMFQREVLNLSDYEDMQDLILAADGMINDFSSSMWDFMLTGKPGFMFAVDLQHYIDTTEVYTPVSEWPFPKATNNDQLEKNILEFDEDQYRQDCRRHYEELGGCETGETTRLVCERIYGVCF